MTTATVLLGVGILIVITAAVMALWIVDAQRADRIAADPERVTRGRRWWSRFRKE